jgi:hypothetical protein
MAIEKVGLYSLAYNGLNAVESVVLLMATYPFPNEDLKRLMIEYDLDTLYYSSSDLERAVSFGLDYNFDSFKTIFYNEEYTVLQIKPEIEN